MRKRSFLYVFFGCLLVVVACASKQLWKSHPNMQQASNEYYAATISPIYIFNGYKGFMLYIHNKSTEDLEVDWENTFYIYNGKERGGFISKDMRSGDKLKTPAIISGSLFSKEIFPRELSEYSTMLGSTVYNPMEPGENGVFLSVKVGGKKVTETLTLNFSEEKSK